eukprot:3371784-Alexandrium_andersonii.AAC.1
MSASLVGSEMCIRDRSARSPFPGPVSEGPRVGGWVAVWKMSSPFLLLKLPSATGPNSPAGHSAAAPGSAI